MTQEETVGLTIVHIEETEFSYKRIDRDGLEVAYGILPSFGWDKEKDFFAINLLVTFKVKKESEVEFARHGINMHFSVTSLAKLIKDSPFDLPDYVLEVLVGLAISTARGVVATRNPDNIIIPIINPEEFVKGMRDAWEKKNKENLE